MGAAPRGDERARCGAHAGQHALDRSLCCESVGPPSSRTWRGTTPRSQGEAPLMTARTLFLRDWRRCRKIRLDGPHGLRRDVDPRRLRRGAGRRGELRRDHRSAPPPAPAPAGRPDVHGRLADGGHRELGPDPLRRHERVERAPDVAGAPGAFTRVTTTPAASYVDAALSPATSYWYRLRSGNANGWSTYSPAAKVTTAATTPPPNPIVTPPPPPDPVVTPPPPPDPSSRRLPRRTPSSRRPRPPRRRCATPRRGTGSCSAWAGGRRPGPSTRGSRPRSTTRTRCPGRRG